MAIGAEMQNRDGGDCLLGSGAAPWLELTLPVHAKQPGGGMHRAISEVPAITGRMPIEKAAAWVRPDLPPPLPLIGSGVRSGDSSQRAFNGPGMAQERGEAQHAVGRRGGHFMVD
jgi:hypothetical protein